MAQTYSFTTLSITRPAPGVVECRLNRPKKLNAFDIAMWNDIRVFFEQVSDDPSVRVVLVTGEGRMFTSGLDFMAMSGMGPSEGEYDVGHHAVKIRKVGTGWQDAFSNMEKCGKVVIACTHNACIGAGIEYIAAADIRMCSADCYFKMLEIDIGLAADVGGLQRFPKIVGNDSLVRELVLSGRRMEADEALRLGFVSRVCDTQEELYKQGLQLAKDIAAKSPIALLGTKSLLNFSRDHSVKDSLDYALTWNAAMLQTGDMKRAIMARMSRSTPEFPDLPDLKGRSNL